MIFTLNSITDLIVYKQNTNDKTGRSDVNQATQKYYLTFTFPDNDHLHVPLCNCCHLEQDYAGERTKLLWTVYLNCPVAVLRWNVTTRLKNKIP